MSGFNFTTPSLSVSDRALNGGLNSTSGPLNLANNESSDLQNIDFNKFGSIIKRNGYTVLTNIGGVTVCDGLHWYQYVKSGAIVREAVNISNGSIYKMDSLDGTWDDITGTVTVTATNFCDFENFLNKVYITNGTDLPVLYDGSSASAANVSQDFVTIGITKAKFVRQFNNYLFLANVTVSGTAQQSRIYWSTLKDAGSWSATSFIDVSKDDGQDITGIKVLGGRLVIFKRNSIYLLTFTGDPDIPFILPDGGKTNSPVGCSAPFSIQEVENGIVFLSYDGFYFFDGNNSFKISDKITTTFDGYNKDRITQARSLIQRDKNRYMCALPGAGATTNNKVLVWDWFNNAWSVYVGVNASAMSKFLVDGLTERPYFSDYLGYTYRLDTGTDDYPASVQTAISSYYYTNWKHYDDLMLQKRIPKVQVYYQTANSVLTFAYSYDFENVDQYTNTFTLATSTDTYGSGVYGTSTYAGSGGRSTQRHLRGRGRTVRFKFENTTLGETFQVDGFGTTPSGDTDVR